MRLFAVLSAVVLLIGILSLGPARQEGCAAAYESWYRHCQLGTAPPRWVLSFLDAEAVASTSPWTPDEVSWFVASACLKFTADPPAVINVTRRDTPQGVVVCIEEGGVEAGALCIAGKVRRSSLAESLARGGAVPGCADGGWPGTMTP